VKILRALKFLSGKQVLGITYVLRCATIMPCPIKMSGRICSAFWMNLRKRGNPLSLLAASEDRRRFKASRNPRDKSRSLWTDLLFWNYVTVKRNLEATSAQAPPWPSGGVGMAVDAGERSNSAEYIDRN